MSDEIKIVAEQKTRRSAIKTAAQVAVTAPAVGLLLSAGTKSAMAQAVYNPNGFFADDAVTLDDFVSGDQTGSDVTVTDDITFF